MQLLFSSKNPPFLDVLHYDVNVKPALSVFEWKYLGIFFEIFRSLELKLNNIEEKSLKIYGQG